MLLLWLGCGCWLIVLLLAYYKPVYSLLLFSVLGSFCSWLYFVVYYFVVLCLFIDCCVDVGLLVVSCLLALAVCYTCLLVRV